MIKYFGPERYEVISNVIKLNGLLKLNTAAEVGVRTAETSEYILRNNQDIFMLLVDPYKSYVDVGDYKFEEEQQNVIKEAARVRLREFSDRFTWMYLESIPAAKQVEDGSLDFVFIDANHDEPYIYADMYAWYPKVRSGGVLFLHDISMQDVNKVAKAWCSKFGKTLIQSDTNSDVGIIEL